MLQTPHRWLLRCVNDARQCLLRDLNYIGRDPGCDLVIQSAKASRRHCRIERVGEGWLVRDLDSRNGITVNGLRVTEQPLAIGDTLQVGELDFVLERVEQGEPDAAPDTQCTQVVAKVRQGEERLWLEAERWRETRGPNQTTPAPTPFEALYAGAVTAARAENEGEVFDALLLATRATFHADAASLYRFSADGRESTTNAVGSTLGETAARELARLTFDSGESSLRASPVRRGACHWLAAIPMRWGAPESLVLVLSGEAEERRLPTTDDLELLIACCNQAVLGVRALRERVSLKLENEALHDRIGDNVPLVGESPAMLKLKDMIARVARASSPVLLCGESGTGKELVAHAVHAQSRVAQGPFVAVNCGALAPTLVDSELFGHEKGAFTGAERQKPGYFERAHGGTLFLDEIAELSLESQTRLLRVLETFRVRRVGGSREIDVSVRLIAASHRHLARMVEEGSFREDLYYRVQVVTLEVPPLRDRLEDLPALCNSLIARSDAPRRVRGISEAALTRLRRHPFGGNVRELRNILERALILGDSELIEPSDLIGLGETPRLSKPPTETSVQQTLEEMEALHIRRVLESVGWNKSQAAVVLGIERPTIYAKIKKHGLEPV